MKLVLIILIILGRDYNIRRYWGCKRDYESCTRY